jgi:predicted GH43/DUF377 family glycosyl hydrolase
MTWSLPREVLPRGGPWEELDAGGASSPCVLEADGGGRRLWYAGSDGTTTRILSARLARDGTCQRAGIAIDAGFAGETDRFGVDAPCVVRIPAGYLMAYGGSDGPDTRLHMATSADGERWEAHGTFMHRAKEDAVGAAHPCLVVTNRWWLFYAGYDGSDNGRHATILAAVSDTGASWDRVGIVLEPESGEVAVREPCVLDAFGSFHMFYVSDDDHRSMIAFASSADGLAWARRGTTLAPPPHRRGVHSPCVLRGGRGDLQLLYAAPRSPEPGAPDRLWSVEGERLSA